MTDTTGKIDNDRTDVAVPRLVHSWRVRLIPWPGDGQYIRGTVRL